MDFVKVHRTLYDVTIPSMTAGQLLELDSNMQATVNGALTSFRTNRPGVPTTANIAGTYAGEIDSIEVVPAIGSNGAPVYGGTNVWPVVDGQNYRHYVDIPCDAVILSMPLHSRVYGGSSHAHLLGTPFWRLCLQALGGAQVPSMPLQNSTIKFNQSFRLSFFSLNGFAAANGGLRVIVKGWIYQPQDLAYFAPGWQTSITYTTPDRDVDGKAELSTSVTMTADQINISTWKGMPGGTVISGPKVSPYVHYAINAQQTDPNTRFVFSNESTTYGQSGNVANEYQDLGLDAVTNATALLIKAYGVTPITRPSNIGRFGFIVDGTELPSNPNTSDAGLVVSDAVNDYFFGDIGPNIGDEGTGTGYAQKYRPVPLPDGQQILIYQEKFAPFIAGNGTAIPAGAVAFAEEGVVLEGL
jgi:hypothetical protein